LLVRSWASMDIICGPPDPGSQRTNSMPSADPKSLRGFAPAIPMMQAAQPQTGNHLRGRPRLAFDRSPMGRVLFQGIVNPIVVVVVHVIANQPSQVSFVQCDDVVQDLTAAASDPSLRSPVLPGRPYTRALRLQTGCLQERDHIGIEFRIVVQEDITKRT